MAAGAHVIAFYNMAASTSCQCQTQIQMSTLKTAVIIYLLLHEVEDRVRLGGTLAMIGTVSRGSETREPLKREREREREEGRMFVLY